MLVEEKKVSIQASGMKDTVDFRAKLDGMMFDNLINGIYSNKIGAGIREYATNARDGHARRGNLDTPFEVSLPTKDKAFFEVRDFGSSLTHDEVFNIYAVLGESTKRNTNNETGCLGLGSKSAFAYTNNFSVTCWKDGIKRDYSCYIGDAGQPKVSLIAEIPSNEPQGVRVSYAVKQDDIDDFNIEASKQLRGFDPMPEIKRHNHKYSPLKEDNLLLKGDNWVLYKTEQPSGWGRNPSKPMAIQGSVAYPINPNNPSFRTAIRNFAGAKAEHVIKMLENTDVIIRFDIGKLKMTTSREELAYDDKTCENMALECLKVIEEVQTKLDNEYKNCKSLKEARMLRAKTRDTGVTDIERILNIRDRFWNNQKVDPYVHVAEHAGLIGQLKESYRRPSSWNNNIVNEFLGNTVTGSLRFIHEHNYRNKFGEFKGQFAYPEPTNKNADWNRSTLADHIRNIKVLIEIDNVDNATARLRKFWKDIMKSSDSNFMWVRVKDVQDGVAFLENIYHDNPSNVWYLHNLDELKMPSKKSSSSGVTIGDNERKLRYITTSRYAYSSDASNYEAVDVSKATDKLPIVFFKGNKFYLTEDDYNKETNEFRYIDLRTHLNTWKTGFKFYVINGQTYKFYEDNKSKFVEVMDVLKPEWIKDNPNWELEYAQTQWKSDDSENLMYGKKLLTLRKKGLTFQAIDNLLTQKEDYIKDGKRGYKFVHNILPKLYSTFLEKEMEQALIKHRQPAQGFEFQMFCQRDPVLKYLMSEVSEWGIDGDLFEALNHYKTTHNL